MKIKKFIYSELRNFLQSKSIDIESSISDDSYFSGINSLELAKENDITFFHNTKYADLLAFTKAKACFVNKEHSKLLNKLCLPIIVSDPYIAYALTTNFLFPKQKSNGFINSSSNIDDLAVIGNNVQVNYNVSIKENTKIDDNCILYDNVIIGPNVVLGAISIVMSNCVISNSSVGENCLIKPGAKIGEKGFGFTPSTKVEIRHIGNVLVGNNVEIGSNTTIDQAVLHSTIISDNVRIDNLVHIAHNVCIGQNTIIAGQTGIAGSTKIGKNCLIGGQVGIAGHLIIEDNVTIAAKSGVTKNIKKNSIIAGFPAVDIKIWKKNIINQYRKIK